MFDIFIFVCYFLNFMQNIGFEKTFEIFLSFRRLQKFAKKFKLEHVKLKFNLPESEISRLEFLRILRDIL